ncbi:MAG: transcription termination/antitermination factor NusG [Ruminococcaceae bacterium]|nr:transcription termination/antitermination factor NusG [Oscillospiraceae bacterium]
METAKWYVVHTFSGYENKVKTNLEKMVENRGLHNNIVEIKLPEEEVVEIKDDQKKVIKRKKFPGYLFLKMTMDNDTWYIVRNTRGVTGFVGPGSKPVPLTEEEIISMELEKRVIELDFEVGDDVRITEGSFEGFIGVVQSINMAEEKFTVLVSMLGRETPVEFEFGQAEKVE